MSAVALQKIWGIMRYVMLLLVLVALGAGLSAPTDASAQENRARPTWDPSEIRKAVENHPAVEEDPEPRRSSREREMQALDFNPFYDECDDAGHFDVAKFAAADDRESFVAFGWRTCNGKPVARAPDEAIFFEIWDGTWSNVPSLLAVQWTDDAFFALLRTNGSTDSDNWTVADSGYGSLQQSAGGTTSVFTVDAASTGFPFKYVLRLATFGQDGNPADAVPNPGLPPVAFPRSCDRRILNAATVRTEPDETRSTAASLRDHGYEVSSISPTAGTMLVSGIDNLEAIRGAHSAILGADRPKAFRAAAVNDPEPTAWAIDQLGLERAWGIVPHASVEVAVLDTGVDGSRPDLAGRVLPGYDAIAGGSITDNANSALGPHGTGVSGIVGGTRNNGLEVTGANPGAKIRPVRVFDHSNCATDAALIAGLDWAAAQPGVRIINLSLGGPSDSPELAAAVRRAHDAGKILIAAAGNDQVFAPDRPNYPASYPEVVAIGATGPGPQMAPYSQGANAEFAAPGGAGEGTRRSDVAFLDEFDQISYGFGTSFAAPYAAGIVSLALQLNPELRTDGIRQGLIVTATDIPDTTADGHGLIDAPRFLEWISEQATPARAPIGTAPSPDGNPSSSRRLDTDDPLVASVAVSRTRFGNAGANLAVLSRSDRFPDALAASPLTGDGPLLFTGSDRLDSRVADELSRTVGTGGTVYLLGGRAALSGAVEEAVRDLDDSWRIVRLAGPDRYATSQAIAREVLQRSGQPASELLLARGFGPPQDPEGTAAWADAITAGAFAAHSRTPLVVVPTDRLRESDRRVVEELTGGTARVTILGGTAAVSHTVEEQASAIAPTRRAAGRDRAETAAVIARGVWRQPAGSAGTRMFINPYDARGWILGLATAGLAADYQAPILGVADNGVPDPTAAYIASCGQPRIDAYVGASQRAIPQQVASELDRLDGQSC